MRAPDTLFSIAEQTTVVHHKRERCDIYIGRPGPWGNPFRVEDFDSREDCLAIYAEWLQRQPRLLEQLRTLRGKVLGCWCAPKACHGHVLAAFADGLDWDAYLPKPPPYGLQPIGNIGGTLPLEKLPVNAVIVSPAGLVVQLSRHWVEVTYETKDDGEQKVTRCKMCDLIELGRWRDGRFHEADGQIWTEPSTYKARGSLGGWAAWGA